MQVLHAVEDQTDCDCLRAASRMRWMLRIDADGLDTGGEIATRAIEDH